MQILEVKFLKETMIVKYAHDAEAAEHGMMTREVFIKYVGFSTEIQEIAESIGRLVSDVEEHIAGEDDEAEEDMRIK